MKKLIKASLIFLGLLTICGCDSNELTPEEAVDNALGTSMIVTRNTGDPLTYRRNSTLEASETLEEYLKLVTYIDIENQHVTFSWSGKTEEDNNKFVIKTLSSDDSHVKLSPKYSTEVGSSFQCTLVGTATCGEVSKSLEYPLTFTRTAETQYYKKITEVKKITSGLVKTRGYLIGGFCLNSTEGYAGTLLLDGNDGITLYAGQITSQMYDSKTGALLFNYGDLIEVSGNVSPYNGLWEMKPTSIEKVDESDDDGLIEQPVFTTEYTVNDIATLASDTSELLEKSNRYAVLSEKVKLTSSIASIDPAKAARWALTMVNESGDECSLHVNYHIGKEARIAIHTLLTSHEGEYFNFKGWISSGTEGIELSPIVTATHSAVECFSF